MRKKYRPILVLLAAVLLPGVAAAGPAAVPRKASGRAYISGLVYLDVNRNGWRDAREPGIPDLPVVVDGGASVFTDRTGGFMYPGLSEGPHRLTIEPSEIPPEFRPFRKLNRDVYASADPGLPLEIRLSWRPPPPPKVVVVSATAAAEPQVDERQERQRALVAIEQTEHKLSRLKGSGYQVLVQDTVTRVEAALREARLSLDGGDAASAIRIAEAWSAAVEDARRQIQTQTQQPLRW